MGTISVTHRKFEVARTPTKFHMLLLAVVLLGDDASAMSLRAEEGKVF